MGSAPRFNFQVESRNHVARVALDGELDLATAPLLGEHLAPIEGNGFTDIVLDLRDVRFLDSSGLSALLAARNRAGVTGQHLLLLGAGPCVRRVFELTGLQSHLDEERGAEVLYRFTMGGSEPMSRTGPSGSSEMPTHRTVRVEAAPRLSG